MTVELTREPTSASAGDALYFEVSGSSDEQMSIVVTADGDEMQSSPVFGIEDSPEGTGKDRFTLQVYGGTDGDFTLEVYDYADDPSTTDPIYYFADAEYTYPDADDVKDALEAALPGLEATVTKSGSTLTILLGGKYDGHDMRMTIDPTGINGSETTALVDAAQSTGPYRWGPVVLPADDYTADVLIVGGDNDGNSNLSAPMTFTVSS
jgi:hypothetical protein